MLARPLPSFAPIPSKALLRALVLLAAPSFVFGCAPPPEAELLEVTRVHPARVEPGRTLQLEGSGFPPGRTSRIRLEGTIFRPGAEPRGVRVELAGRATSSEHVDARFTGDAFERLGGRGTLRGRVTVLFATADREGTVVGRAPVTLDLRPASVDGIGDALARQRRASELSAQLGLGFGDEPPSERGLPIERIEEASVAARAGLIVGDRVVEAHGVMTHALSDLVPPPGVEQLELRVERRGEAAPFAVALPIEAERHGMSRETVRWLQVGLGWVLLVLLWLAPTARVADWLGARLRRRRRAPSASSGPRVGWIRRTWRRHGRGLARPALAVTAFCTLPALERAMPLRIPLEAVVLGALAVRVSGAWLAGSSGAGRAGSSGGGRERALSLAHAAAGAAAIAVALGAVAALGGTTDLAALHGQQGAAPWTWSLLESPLGPLALGLVLVGGGTAPAAVARGTSPGARAARALDDVVLAVVAATTIAVLLGGWGGAETAAGAIGRTGQALSFVALATLLWTWMRSARRLSSPTAGGVGAALVLALTLIGGTAARVAADPPPELEAGLAQVVGGALALLLVTVLARIAAGRVRSTPEPSQPFL